MKKQHGELIYSGVLQGDAIAVNAFDSLIKSDITEGCHFFFCKTKCVYAL